MTRSSRLPPSKPACRRSSRAPARSSRIRRSGCRFLRRLPRTLLNFRGFLLCGVCKSVGAGPGGLPQDELGPYRNRTFVDEERRRLDLGLIWGFSKQICPFACQELAHIALAARNISAEMFAIPAFPWPNWARLTLLLLRLRRRVSNGRSSFQTPPTWPCSERILLMEFSKTDKGLHTHPVPQQETCFKTSEASLLTSTTS